MTPPNSWIAAANLGDVPYLLAVYQHPRAETDPAVFLAAKVPTPFVFGCSIDFR